MFGQREGTVGGGSVRLNYMDVYIVKHRPHIIVKIRQRSRVIWYLAITIEVKICCTLFHGDIVLQETRNQELGERHMDGCQCHQTPGTKWRRGRRRYGALQRNLFPKIRVNGSGWVGPGLTRNFFLFWKSSQNGPKPVLIFWSSIH